MEVVITTGAIRCEKLRSNRHHQLKVKIHWNITSCVEGRHNMSQPPASWPLTFWPWKWCLSHVGYLCTSFSLQRPLCSRIRPNTQLFTGWMPFTSSNQSIEALKGNFFKNFLTALPVWNNSHIRTENRWWDTCEPIKPEYHSVASKKLET